MFWISRETVIHLSWKNDVMYICLLVTRRHLEQRKKVSKSLNIWSITLTCKQVAVPSSEFSFQYKPTLTTLFRFSALTFNGHHIHLDQKYAQEVEGYPGNWTSFINRFHLFIALSGKSDWFTDP